MWALSFLASRIFCISWPVRNRVILKTHIRIHARLAIYLRFLVTCARTSAISFTPNTHTHTHTHTAYKVTPIQSPLTVSHDERDIDEDRHLQSINPCATHTHTHTHGERERGFRTGVILPVDTRQTLMNQL